MDSRECSNGSRGCRICWLRGRATAGICSCGAERREWTATAGPIFERALAHEAAFAAKLENWPVERRTREMFRERVSIGSRLTRGESRCKCRCPRSPLDERPSRNLTEPRDACLGLKDGAVDVVQPHWFAEWITLVLAPRTQRLTEAAAARPT